MPEPGQTGAAVFESFADAPPADQFMRRVSQRGSRDAQRRTPARTCTAFGRECVFITVPESAARKKEREQRERAASKSGAGVTVPRLDQDLPVRTHSSADLPDKYDTSNSIDTQPQVRRPGTTNGKPISRMSKPTETPGSNCLLSQRSRK